MTYAALAISGMALLFTVSSFWWLHSRPSKVRIYEPTTWAAYVSRERSAIRMPLVLHNPGAAALVVIRLRVRFLESGESMDWEWTRTRVNPKGDDIKDVTAPFSILGGAAVELVAEFRGTFPGVVPEQRAYPVAIDAWSSRHEGWQEVLRFDLQLTNLIHPANYIVYTNQPDYLNDQQFAEGAANLAKLREQFGLTGTDQG